MTISTSERKEWLKEQIQASQQEDDIKKAYDTFLKVLQAKDIEEDTKISVDQFKCVFHKVHLYIYTFKLCSKIIVNPQLA